MPPTMDLMDVIASLAIERPIFHSEADFQHSLAWRIHQKYPAARVRLERPFNFGRRGYCDIWIEHAERITAIELKYKTRRLACFIGDEAFSLKSQNACDLGKYDYLRDIIRLEQIANSTPYARGLAILLTNDKNYWQPRRKIDAVDRQLALTDNRVVRGCLAWDPRASDGTTRGRAEPLRLNGSYRLQWTDYSQPVNGANGHFRLLVVEVEEPRLRSHAYQLESRR